MTDGNTVDGYHSLAVQCTMDWCDKRRDALWADLTAFMGEAPEDRDRMLDLGSFIFEQIESSTAGEFALSEAVVATALALRKLIMIGNEIPATAELVRKLIEDLTGAPHWPGGPVMEGDDAGG